MQEIKSRTKHFVLNFHFRFLHNMKRNMQRRLKNVILIDVAETG